MPTLGSWSCYRSPVRSCANHVHALVAGIAPSRVLGQRAQPALCRPCWPSLRLRYPPQFKYAKFATSGTVVFVGFDSQTLRGAIPIDDDGPHASSGSP